MREAASAGERAWLAEFAVDDERWRKFEVYYERLVAWNQQLNLTSITERREVFIKHFADSLAVVRLPEWRFVVHAPGAGVMDVGTGAGFPGLPLAICHPDIPFVLADAQAKRLRFLADVVAALGLHNVRLVHGRAEDLARDPAMRGRFAAVTARAVARLNVLLELTVPFCRVGGFVFAYKGPGVEEELAEGERAAGVLGAKLARIVPWELPEGMGSRRMVVTVQERPVPAKYPRKAGTPQRAPLGTGMHA
ncbi:ribosomal RNA small subunit methyltransferase G [Alicyclobacillus cellulosilyticus]|uniref:Ribosomal RNA small subunit methyltransferase G n=1 Tax=Alicyclobacillus cellulosilyticus TaxID=1003997 RepID=A0A917NF74_9BACL|nr:16S rRNA (guanine(527)-N(7))-methyltransferase RsmG [Alicyclobacillus cellulosilyticus]GGI95052.1 ribosomal RNA small subunit methyltransferase G [Alicyclobacillus cellulosilyticus]